MNELVVSVLLAIIQGLSEWLPISSSGHLVLFSHLFGFENTIAFDISLHFGTLMAVFVYFGKDIVAIIDDILKGKWKTENAKLGFMVIIATIPTAVIGFIFKDYFEAAFNSLLVVSIGFAITSLILFIASSDFGNNNKNIPSKKNALFIGLAQALAILPGISRSGSTIASGLVSGLNEKSALKFSFLLAIPAIFGASILGLGTEKLPPMYIIPTIVSFAVGMLTIHLLFKIIVNSKKNLRWFAIYEAILAIALFIYLLFR